MQRLWHLSLLLCAVGTGADDVTNTYDNSEEVTVWTNKVGPYHNPQETYDFYTLPFCKPNMKAIRHKYDSLGVTLEGSDLLDSGLHLKFNVDESDKKVCDMVIDDEVAAVMTEAVKNHYWYQLYVDELPIWGMVGEYVKDVKDAKDKASEAAALHGFIYTHQIFSIGVNGNRVIDANLTLDKPMPIVSGKTHTFTVSVSWKPTTKAFDSRYDRYHDYDFFEHQIHWFSIFNSFMMVVFLCGLVTLILMRTLKNDYVRFTSEDGDDLDLDRVVDESGWKQVHGDVFRPPPYLLLYASLLGTGYQLFFMVFCVISLTLLGEFYHERGTIVTTLIACYSLTSFVAGYAGAAFYKRNNGPEWKKAMAATALLFPGICMGAMLTLNFVATLYGSSQFLGFGSLFLIACIWLFVASPLVLFGTIVGRSMAVVADFPCRVNTLMRPIPEGKWFTRPHYIVLFSGIMPFGSIFIEMYFIFTSFWNYKFYYVYGFMLLVYVILIVVTVCVTIVATYFLLNAEDYRWHWTSFLCGGSTAFYVFLYAIYYFFTKTRMTGFFQTVFYFGYMGCFCAGLFVLCGTIGHMGTNLFIRRIYQYIKSD